jgi:inner membrane protein
VDSITHVALGAIVGEAIAGKSLGKRAMFLGAIAQSIPDIDFIAAFFLSPADNLLIHRGLTHSFLFGGCVTVVLALLCRRWYKPHNISYFTWTLFFGTEIMIHLLLDACNAYGVGWFEPFNHLRVSWNILFVADPFYSLPLGISLIALMTLDSKKTSRRLWIFFGLIASSGYLLYAMSNKIMITRQTTAALEKGHISHKRFFTTPTPLNTWLWYVVVENDSGFFATYHSILDENPINDFTHFQKHPEWLEEHGNRNEVSQLLRFSQGFYTVEQSADTLIINDLRFGQIAGWDDPHAKFVFHYYVNYPKANLLVIQRGRFSNWNQRTFHSLINRIKGN